MIQSFVPSKETSTKTQDTEAQELTRCTLKHINVLGRWHVPEDTEAPCLGPSQTWHYVSLVLATPDLFLLCYNKTMITNTVDSETMKGLGNQPLHSRKFVHNFRVSPLNCSFLTKIQSIIDYIVLRYIFTENNPHRSGSEQFKLILFKD